MALPPVEIIFGEMKTHRRTSNVAAGACELFFRFELSFLDSGMALPPVEKFFGEMKAHRGTSNVAAGACGLFSPLAPALLDFKWRFRRLKSFGGNERPPGGFQISLRASVAFLRLERRFVNSKRLARRLTGMGRIAG